MGDAKRKAVVGIKQATLDFLKLDLVLTDSDKVTLAGGQVNLTNTEALHMRAVRFFLHNAVAAAFPQGMDLRDSRDWAQWVAILDQELPVIQMPMAAVDWLRKHVCQDDLKLPAQWARWRVETVKFLDQIVPDEHPGEAE